MPTLLLRAVAPEALPSLRADGVLDWLSRAEGDSPSLRQARLAVEAAEAATRKASLAHAPSVDLNASYTHSNDNDTVTSIFPRTGKPTAVGVTLTIPVFASGATQSKVVEALALRDKAASELDLARRTLVIGVRQAFVSTLSALSQARALGTAERSQALSVRANQRGYEVGIKTNADVLEAQGHTPKPYVRLAFRRYLECGIFAHGFARAWCDDCGHDYFVAYSCKGRGVCPLCNTRRMVETATHLTDHVFPRLPVRQWVLWSVSKRLR